MHILKRGALVGILVFGPPVAWGCGPFFPEELIVWRKDALLEAPPAFFSKEIRRLIDRPRTDFPVVEHSEDFDGEHKHDRANAEAAGLAADAAEKIAAMRREADGDAAYAVGDGLPEAVRLYTAGAVDFHGAFPRPAGDGAANAATAQPKADNAPIQSSLDKARQRFAAVLALPVEQHGMRAAWAAYMLGRIAAHQGNYSAAAGYFQQTRELVKSGLPDPLGLAVASLGEEARLHVRPGELAQSIGLYLQQLSYGSKSAEFSLKIVVRKLETDTALLDEALGNALARQLFFAHLYTKDVGSPFPIQSNHYYSWLADDRLPIPDRLPAIWDRITDAIERQGIENVAGADWLAAAAYNNGRFDLAQRLVNRDQSALASWIKAKLALRAGNQEAALAAYAETVRAFPAEDRPKSSDFYVSNVPEEPDDVWDEASLLYRVDGERGVLRLSRGEYTQALSHLYAASARYWADAAYVAERILTLEELKTFVDHSVPEPSYAERVAATASGNLNPAMRLRQLLARRLMREGHREAAIAYFDNLELRTLAEEYRDAMQEASSLWRGRIGQAQAWYAAAMLARFKGMELMGYELAPDFANWGGAYSLAYMSRDAGGPSSIEGEMCSADEQRRFEAHRAKPEVRFHYRLVAAEHAARAADLLPASSQAFAAVLCQAVGWNLAREPERARLLYQRYLREGAYVPWGKQFGRHCPAPDFHGAGQRLWAERFMPWR